MGVTFDQIVGPRSMWGIPGSWSLYLTHKAYQRYRENEIPTAANCSVKVYVTYSAAGSASGGGGVGCGDCNTNYRRGGIKWQRVLNTQRS